LIVCPGSSSSNRPLHSSRESTKSYPYGSWPHPTPYRRFPGTTTAVIFPLTSVLGLSAPDVVDWTLVRDGRPPSSRSISDQNCTPGIPDLSSTSTARRISTAPAFMDIVTSCVSGDSLTAKLAVVQMQGTPF